MKKSRVDLAQLKAGVGAKLKRKCQPLSPASASSSKKKVVEKDPNEEHPISPHPEREIILSTAKDPTFLALIALEEAEKPAVVVKTQTSASIIPSLHSPLVSGKKSPKMMTFAVQ